MTKLAAFLAFACAILALAGPATALPIVGAAEDATKYAPDGGTALYQKMKNFGLKSNRVSVFWNFNQPTTIAEKSFLDRVVPEAAGAGVQLVFAIYADPRIPGGVTAINRNPDAFCNYAAMIARTYPSVTKIIVGNEPNQKRFWQPQPRSGTDFYPVQAKCYDALKAVNSGISVIGVGLSPRGNDKPTEVNNGSSSPVRFIRDLAGAYRASGRTKPIMDEFAFHCYPNVNSDPVAKGYEWPNIGCVNFDRLKQALWDGFNGTAQPTPGEGTRFVAALGGPLQLVIDETGWQVGVSGLPGYIGAENVPVISDMVHAQYYSQLVNIAACDPSITAFHFLYFLDSPQLTDFQSGMARVDGTPRASADAVGAAIAKGCSSGRVDWKHTTKVVGAKAAKGLNSSGQRAVEVFAKEDYSLAIKFSNGKKKATAIVQGKANLATDVPVPAGFAGGKAKVTFSAWANASRKSSFTLVLG